jgi:ribose transport system permease protein
MTLPPKTSAMKLRAPQLAAWKSSILTPVLILVSLLVLVGIFQPSFLSFYSLKVLAEESAMIMLLAAGLTVAILLGGIDLSVAATASFASVLLALWLPEYGWLGLVAVLLVTTLVGLIQGLIITIAQVPSFVVTLAGQGLVTGIAMLITVKSAVVSEGYEVVGWMVGSLFGLPRAFLISFVLVVILALVMKFLPTGRYVYAIGLAEPAAIMSGIRVKSIRVFAYTLCGFLAGLTGAMMVARSYSGNYLIAVNLLLPSIAAVILGGTAITGGYGSVFRTVLGALSITVMRVAIAIMGVDPGFEPLAYGLLIIIAVALTIDRKRMVTVK